MSCARLLLAARYTFLSSSFAYLLPELRAEISHVNVTFSFPSPAPIVCRIFPSAELEDITVTRFLLGHKYMLFGIEVSLVRTIGSYPSEIVDALDEFSPPLGDLYSFSLSHVVLSIASRYVKTVVRATLVGNVSVNVSFVHTRHNGYFSSL